jgi:thymidylate synthase
MPTLVSGSTVVDAWRAGCQAVLGIQHHRVRNLITEPREHYYARWATILRRGRKSGKLHSSWGSTYFERLLSLDGSDNQIERAIHALTTWQRKETAIVMHLSAPHIDRLKPIGSPCLQFVEVLWDADDTIHLVALYRNHDRP